MTIEALYNMAEQYTNFSCKPKSNKYKVGTIFDEDMSVKWNREELVCKNETNTRLY